jgi:hypothetical protein
MGGIRGRSESKFAFPEKKNGYPIYSCHLQN